MKSLSIYLPLESSAASSLSETKKLFVFPRWVSMLPDPKTVEGTSPCASKIRTNLDGRTDEITDIHVFYLIYLPLEPSAASSLF